MSFFDWVASIRKKPLETRRKIAVAWALVFTVCVAGLWFVAFMMSLPERVERLKGAQTASPQDTRSIFDDFTLPPAPSFPESLLEQTEPLSSEQVSSYATSSDEAASSTKPLP